MLAIKYFARVIYTSGAAQSLAVSRSVASFEADSYQGEASIRFPGLSVHMKSRKNAIVKASATASSPVLSPKSCIRS